MRGSVTVAPKLDVQIMQEFFEGYHSDISPFSVMACEYMFGDNKNDKARREKFLKKKVREYERHALYAAAIIGGKARDFLTPREYEAVTDWLVRYGHLAEKDSHELLEKGIPGIDVINMPRAGFFFCWTTTSCCAMRMMKRFGTPRR